ncbi:DHX38 [Lepeophtheirus salmonis]|uniref:DHX38 n=1 Tax=Lepeophtheirus salmonis TaxID=72036 RepID=A0A7R8H3I0_LEPSM|nr:DHX38 [Lepeophtheirus salmonis]CAF2844483.1 DHX38 [Lepeophtheirus salmonis]
MVAFIIPRYASSLECLPFGSGKTTHTAQKLFEDEFSKIYIWQIHSLMCLMATMEGISTLMWMDLREIPDWNNVKGCIRQLAEKGIIQSASISSTILRDS